MSASPISEYDRATALSGPSPRVRMTADRVRRWEFSTSSFTRRGYDDRDVDRFRHQVADELDLLATQLADLRAENQRLHDHVELHRHGVLPSASNRPQLPGAKEVNLLSAAQREAEQIIAQAHDYARRVAEYARVQYENYLRAAAEDARNEAERAVQDYRASAGSSFDDTVATREALRIFGEMMISHMQAAARHLDDGSEHLARTMDRIARESGAGIGGATPPGAGRPALSPRPEQPRQM
ncbi:DivIVA domain-containing protein [Plantactinospora sp. KLBMP9567]|uniref:DivIVA domain-containing protein n=1 Tax=Plantactinospora sp. KLBMP9567 TaxID=3085900 RepID=UPI00298150AD|nr:DivIVA domain-containing protein [Plantactinospora sp. KLBMP9567]MDW5325775.1 DivIVA domain-containing protein [Plantactinospora sp. KLBMP9567]